MQHADTGRANVTAFDPRRGGSAGGSRGPETDRAARATKPGCRRPSGSSGVADSADSLSLVHILTGGPADRSNPCTTCTPRRRSEPRTVDALYDLHASSRGRVDQPLHGLPGPSGSGQAVRELPGPGGPAVRGLPGPSRAAAPRTPGPSGPATLGHAQPSSPPTTPEAPPPPPDSPGRAPTRGPVRAAGRAW
jgi:hypothetical protein